MKLRRIFATACAVTLLLGMAATPEVADEMKLAITAHAASSEVLIDAAHFPDEKFRESILDGLDKDKNGYLSTKEAAEATSMQCESENVTSLKGIEYLTELTLLDCSNNQLTELDVSKNTKLEWLDCVGNQITELDVSNNTKLEWLHCSNNKLKELNVSSCTELTMLDCGNVGNEFYKYNNEIVSLDVSNNNKLNHLGCFNNKLEKLYVGNNNVLEFLMCFGNKLKSLDISHCPALKSVQVEFNQITSLDISGNPLIVDAYNKGYKDTTGDGAISYDYYYGKGDNDRAMLVIDPKVSVITASKPHTHTWDSGKVTKAATYGAAGVKTYTCTVCGAKKTSSIAKKTVKQVTAKTTYTCTSSAIRINWNKLSGVSGYRLYRYDTAKKTWVGFANIYDPNATNYKISGLSAGTIYKFKVKAFVKENGKTYFGTASSTITTVTKPKTTTISKSNKAATAVRLYWKKLTCTGYRIDRYDSAQKKWVKVKAVEPSKTTEYRISGLKKNTTYKFRIVPYVKVGTKYIYGAASKTYTVKTTK